MWNFLDSADSSDKNLFTIDALPLTFAAVSIMEPFENSHHTLVHGAFIAYTISRAAIISGYIIALTPILRKNSAFLGSRYS